MAANSKQASILVCSENYLRLEVSLNIQIGNIICLDLGINKKYFLLD
jgi:hypothetical protein